MVGERILKRFVIEDRLGSGGFGTVYRAWDERLHRPVAVKVIERAGPGRDRVLREAQAAARLAHPGIVTLYELADDGHNAYLVTELIEGETLRALHRAGRLSDRHVAEIGAGAAEALAHAHAAGVIHRDVKPHNVLVPRGTTEAKLVDFGIARLLDEVTLTAPGDVLGTIAYMAPEQAGGERPGAEADVYSLALTLYESWAGAHPLARRSPAATARAIGEPIPPLRETRPELPEELCLTIDDCLDPNPRYRPRVVELERALDVATGELGPERVPPPVDLEPAPAALESLRGSRPGRGAAATSAALAALCIAVLALGGIAHAAWGLAIPAVVGVIALARPRLALALAVASLSTWLAIVAGEPGAAIVLAVLAAPLPLLPGFAFPWTLAPAAAPALGVLGAAPLYPALAGSGGSAVQRLGLGALGYLWLAAAEALTGANLLLGSIEQAPGGWASSPGTAATEVLIPLLSWEVLAGAALWGVAALLLKPLVAGRALILDLLGAIVWSAGLITGLRLLAAPGDPGSGAVVVAALAGAIAIAIASVARRRELDAPHPV